MHSKVKNVRIQRNKNRIVLNYKAYSTSLQVIMKKLPVSYNLTPDSLAFTSGV